MKVNGSKLQQGFASSRKRFGVSIVVALCAILFAPVRMMAQDDTTVHLDVPPILKIGAHAPDFNLMGVDGKMHALKDYSSAKVLAVIFNCDHCPVAQMYESRIKQMVNDYSSKGVAVVVIMGNDPKAVHLSEQGHTDVGDTFEEMKIRAQYRNFNFPYLYDGENQGVALKYGPTATPHAFIFDQNRILQYEGRIDSNARPQLATKHEAKDAIEALLAGKPVTVTSTPAMGCSTKWAYKEKGAAAEVAEKDHKPVTVEMVTADQLKTLRANSGTNRLLLVNFWTAGCAACSQQMPEIEKMVRMYGKRDLDIVTVNLDKPGDSPAVLQYLKTQHAINRNLQFSGSNPAEAAAAFGPEWTGDVPYTALIDVNGKILFEGHADAKPLEVKRALLKNLPDDRYLGQHDYWQSSF